VCDGMSVLEKMLVMVNGTVLVTVLTVLTVLGM
jgi:hypothetical protein